MRIKDYLYQSQTFGAHLLDILYPPCCARCRRSGFLICPTCLSNISLLPRPFCQHCSKPLPPNGFCAACHYAPIRLSGLRAVGIFQEPLRSFIHALKYDGNVRLAEPLGQLLAQVYHDNALKADLILPVPLHFERQQKRGYNHAQLLARVCAARTNLPMRDDVLVRHRATLAQVDLDRNARQQNVAGAFLCNPLYTNGALRGLTILLIDDVSTTGATLEACAAPIFAAGAKAVWALVLARPE